MIFSPPLPASHLPCASSGGRVSSRWWCCTYPPPCSGPSSYPWRSHPAPPPPLRRRPGRGSRSASRSAWWGWCWWGCGARRPESRSSTPAPSPGWCGEAPWLCTSAGCTWALHMWYTVSYVCRSSIKVVFFTEETEGTELLLPIL